MVCSGPYTPGAAAPANVDAPVLTVTISKLSETTTTENLRLTITTGAGSGNQSPISIVYQGSPYVTKPRPINGTVTIDYEVSKGAPSHYWCAT